MINKWVTFSFLIRGIFCHNLYVWLLTSCNKRLWRPNFSTASTFSCGRTVSVEAGTSSPFIIHPGVPQGSALSSKLFLLFINDLSLTSANMLLCLKWQSVSHFKVNQSSASFEESPGFVCLTVRPVPCGLLVSPSSSNIKLDYLHLRWIQVELLGHSV